MTTGFTATSALGHTHVPGRAYNTYILRCSSFVGLLGLEHYSLVPHSSSMCYIYNVPNLDVK